MSVLPGSSRFVETRIAESPDDVDEIPDIRGEAKLGGLDPCVNLEGEPSFWNDECMPCSALRGVENMWMSRCSASFCAAVSCAC
jgi:hypothetical protein